MTPNDTEDEQATDVHHKQPMKYCIIIMKPMPHTAYTKKYLEDQAARQEEYMQTFKEHSARQTGALEAHTKEIAINDQNFNKLIGIFAKFTDAVISKNT